MLPESASERLRRAEADGEGDVEHTQPRLSGKARGGLLHAPPGQITAKRLADMRREKPMEMEGREIRDSGQLCKIDRLFEVCINIG
jgi:hypothetical protein